MISSRLFAIASLALASSALAQSNFAIVGVTKDDLTKCRGSGWQNDVMTRFTGIFFGNFTTGGSQDILGGLAVKGNMHAPNYIINANHGADCSDLSSLKSYGLVVGGTIDTFNTQVHGSAYIKGSGTIEEVMQLEKGCVVTDDQGTGIFDFPLVEAFSIANNRDYALLGSTVFLRSDGGLSYFNDEELDLYEVINFHSCNSRICTRNPFSESVPHQILFGQGNWNGVQGSTLNPEKTYIMNIPVNNGDTIIIDTNNPALGFNPCKLVWNFFPIDSRGNYMPDGEFTLIRRTSNQLGGVVLAPRGHIRDGSTGNFAGTVVGLDYTWENLNAGVEIHDFHAAGGKCDAYDGCIPAHVTTTPLPAPTITRSTRIRSRTATWAPIVTPSSSAAHDTITVTTTGACTGRVTETKTVGPDNIIAFVKTTTITETTVTTSAADTIILTTTAADITVTSTITTTAAEFTIDNLPIALDTITVIVTDTKPARERTVTEAGNTVTETGNTVTEAGNTVTITEAGKTVTITEASKTVTVTEAAETVTSTVSIIGPDVVTTTVFVEYPCNDGEADTHHHHHHHRHDNSDKNWNKENGDGDEDEEEDDCEEDDEDWEKHDDK